MAYEANGPCFSFFFYKQVRLRASTEPQEPWRSVLTGPVLCAQPASTSVHLLLAVAVLNVSAANTCQACAYFFF